MAAGDSDLTLGGAEGETLDFELPKFESVLPGERVITKKTLTAVLPFNVKGELVDNRQASVKLRDGSSLDITRVRELIAGGMTTPRLEDRHGDDHNIFLVYLPESLLVGNISFTTSEIAALERREAVKRRETFDKDSKDPAKGFVIKETIYKVGDLVENQFNDIEIKHTVVKYLFEDLGVSIPDVPADEVLIELFTDPNKQITLFLDEIDPETRRARIVPIYKLVAEFSQLLSHMNMIGDDFENHDPINIAPITYDESAGVVNNLVRSAFLKGLEKEDLDEVKFLNLFSANTKNRVITRINLFRRNIKTSDNLSVVESLKSIADYLGVLVSLRNREEKQNDKKKLTRDIWVANRFRIGMYLTLLALSNPRIPEDKRYKEYLSRFTNVSVNDKLSGIEDISKIVELVEIMPDILLGEVCLSAFGVQDNPWKSYLYALTLQGLAEKDISLLEPYRNRIVNLRRDAEEKRIIAKRQTDREGEQKDKNDIIDNTLFIIDSVISKFPTSG